MIGCIFLRDIRFFPTDTSVKPPPGFAPNVVQGKGYDLAVSPALSDFEELLRRLLQVNVDIDLSEPWHRGGRSTVTVG
ncbi:MAG: hypothetical protein M3500_07435 [Actinomycetota bacterium]|nr:hypothetical protein [Actinomycetota bacterium]